MKTAHETNSVYATVGRERATPAAEKVLSASTKVGGMDNKCKPTAGKVYAPPSVSKMTFFCLDIEEK